MFHAASIAAGEMTLMGHKPPRDLAGSAEACHPITDSAADHWRGREGPKADITLVVGIDAIGCNLRRLLGVLGH
jgi:hypothetical protein